MVSASAADRALQEHDREQSDLDRLSGPGLLRPLIHKGGLRADVLTDGEVRLGASIQPVRADLLTLTASHPTVAGDVHRS